jgi:hypothetical protein
MKGAKPLVGKFTDLRSSLFKTDYTMFFNWTRFSDEELCFEGRGKKGFLLRGLCKCPRG